MDTKLITFLHKYVFNCVVIDILFKFLLGLFILLSLVIFGECYYYAANIVYSNELSTFAEIFKPASRALVGFLILEFVIGVVLFVIVYPISKIVDYIDTLYWAIDK